MKRRFEVFAVGTDAAQVIWRGAGTGLVELELGGHTRRVPPTDELGAWTVRGLSPATSYVLRVDGKRTATLRTLERPRGELLARVATISDLHVGETGVGHWPRVRSARSRDDWRDAHPLWCVEAAVDELGDWEPDLFVVKGDLAHNNRVEEYESVVPILKRAGAPLLVIGGNHDGGNIQRAGFEGAMRLAGLPVEPGVQVHTMGDVTVIAADTRIPGHHSGTTATVHDATVAAAAAARGPVLVFLHHQLMTTRLPWYLPTGVPVGEAERFCDELSAVAPNAFVSSGHTHRNRARRRGGLTITEVGSPKDYPGVWGAYEVYERGIVQTSWRVAEPRALAWNELTRVTARGVWQRWAPGRIADRCVVSTW